MKNEEGFDDALAAEPTGDGPSELSGYSAMQDPDGGFSFAAAGRAAQRESRERQERIERARRQKLRQVFAIIGGAVVGTVVDALLFNASSDELAYRIIATLFLGCAGGLYYYYVAMRNLMHFIRLFGDHGLRNVNPHDAYLVNAIITAGLLATWAAAGLEKATAHGFLCAIVCEALALFLTLPARSDRAESRLGGD